LFFSIFFYIFITLFRRLKKHHILIECPFFEQIEVTDLDTAKLGDLPGMVIYTVKPGDNLWSIGKRYYVPVDTLKSLNELTSDELQVGQKLLIVKGY
jgi:hypothetical protein